MKSGGTLRNNLFHEAMVLCGQLDDAHRILGIHPGIKVPAIKTQRFGVSG